MNYWKLNMSTGQIARQTIAKYLNIPTQQLCKVIKDITISNHIILHDGRKFKLTLQELSNKK
jgi:predicted transcriptional regulator